MYFFRPFKKSTAQYKVHNMGLRYIKALYGRRHKMYYILEFLRKSAVTSAFSGFADTGESCYIDVTFIDMT
jgi:hypothetical protein